MHQKSCSCVGVLKSVDTSLIFACVLLVPETIIDTRQIVPLHGRPAIAACRQLQSKYFTRNNDWLSSPVFAFCVFLFTDDKIPLY